MRTATRIPLLRIAALDTALRRGSYPNARKIADELEVCTRTIHRDIDFLRDQLGAPLEYDPHRNGYYYSDASFQLPFWKLTEGELLAVFLAQRVLQQYQGTPWAELLSRAFRKIESALPEPAVLNLGQLRELLTFRTSAPAEMPPDVFTALEHALLQGRRIRIRYWSASSNEETLREVDPYHLASVDGQWYLIGFCHLRDAIRMFVPSRIRELQVTDTHSTPPTDFRLDDFLSQSFGVIRGTDETHEVRLRFTPEGARFVRGRTWHPTQRLEPQKDGSLQLDLTVSDLREVKRWVLSWGPDCKVIAPPALRDCVQAALTSATKLYSPAHSSPPPAPRASTPTRRKRPHARD